MLTIDQISALSEEKIKELLEMLTRNSGTYRIARLLSEVAMETSAEMFLNGNKQAIVHADARALSGAVECMRLMHLIRFKSDLL